MYAVQQPRGATRLVGVSVAALATAGAAWLLIYGMVQKVIVVPEKIMEVTMIAPKIDATPKPEMVQPDAKIEQSLDPPPIPMPIIPDQTFVAEDSPVVAPSPAIPTPTGPAVTSGAPDTRPKLLTQTKPPYPVSSIRAQEQGMTTLDLCVSEGGRVTSASVASSSGSKTLDDAALKWIQTARFRAGTMGGRATAMCNYNVIYQWDLKDAGRS